jgi:hypothetical protein
MREGVSSTTYWIEYDAENSFGVPLRGTGQCTVSGGKAFWLPEEPR